MVAPRETVGVEAGKDARMVCIATGVPRPTIGWTFNGFPIDDLNV